MFLFLNEEIVTELFNLRNVKRLISVANTCVSYLEVL